MESLPTYTTDLGNTQIRSIYKIGWDLRRARSTSLSTAVRSKSPTSVASSCISSTINFHFSVFIFSSPHQNRGGLVLSSAREPFPQIGNTQE